MRRSGARVTLAVVCAWSAPAAAADARADLPRGPTGRVLVALEKDASGAAVASRAGLRLDGRAIPPLRVVSVDPGGLGSAEALRRLRRDPAVRYAVREGRFSLRADVSDPALTTPEPDPDAPAGTALQWALERTGFPRAWDVTRGQGALVAVVDTGLDGAHPDLAGKVEAAVDLDDTDEAPALTDEDGHGTHVGSIACAATDNGIGIAGAGHDCRLLVIRS
ncbi:MAG: S8 family serine peptidase, partial [Actinomycetes bacterium]